MKSLPANCEIFVTQDGSPTLSWSYTSGVTEKMHHSGGALSESFFIYHEALLLAKEWPVRVLSLGLGLGYNELITAAQCLKSGVSDWKVWSFEAEPFLRENFSAWLAGGDSQLYGQILVMIADKMQVDSGELKSFAATPGKIEIKGAFPNDATGAGPCTCVFYDAFSKKMDPELWDETNLRKSLESVIAPQCVLATYAATGALNRVLKTLGFRLLPKPGFLGKRESTLAIRDEIR